MTKQRKRPMVMATRSVTVRDYGIFMLKLWLDGLKDVTLIGLSTGALLLDVLAGKGRRPRVFYSVMLMGERFDRWLNLHASLERMRQEDGGDGLFGASASGSDTLLGKVEQITRGGDQPRRGRDSKNRPGPGADAS